MNAFDAVKECFCSKLEALLLFYNTGTGTAESFSLDSDQNCFNDFFHVIPVPY